MFPHPHPAPSTPVDPGPAPLRILYILRGLVPPPVNARRDACWYLSHALEGDVLLPVWWGTEEAVRQKLGPQACPVHTVGRFHYHFLLAGRFQGIRQKVEMFRFFLRMGRRLHRAHRYHCIVVYGHMLTALAGVLLKLLTGAKLMVEIVTDPRRVHIMYAKRGPFTTVASRFMQLFSDLLLHLAVLACDRVMLRYPGQLSCYPLLRRVPASVLHGFVPVSEIVPQPEPAEQYVLLVGYPWYVKGADLLIQAFRRIAPEFPEVKLKLLGHYPDRTELEALAGGCGQIEFLKARPGPEALQIIAGALILVVPSRTEGVARVLIEGMSARRAIIASDAGGMPHYVQHGQNGLLFRSENIAELTDRLRTLLADGELRQRLADNGFHFARTRLNENAYAEGFHRAVALTVSPP